MIGHFTNDVRVMEFINSTDLDKLAPLGTSCPDHFLRTKIFPLVLPLTPVENLTDTRAVKEKLLPVFEEYRNRYAAYYETCKHVNSPAMRDANPVVMLYPGIGMFTFAKDKTTARLASEFYINAINVMKMCIRDRLCCFRYGLDSFRRWFDCLCALIKYPWVKRIKQNKTKRDRIKISSTI